MNGFASMTTSVYTKKTRQISYPITLGDTIGINSVVTAPMMKVSTLRAFLPMRSYMIPTNKIVGIATN